MAGKPVGTMFVEIDLETTKYTKGQKAILAGAEKASGDINRTMKTVGTHSDAMYNAMRKNIQNSLTSIKKSSTSSYAEIQRAKAGAAAKIKAIDDKQYAHQNSLIKSMKKNWKSLSVVSVATATAGVYAFARLSKSIISTGVEFESSMKTVQAWSGATGKELQKLEDLARDMGGSKAKGGASR